MTSKPTSDTRSTNPAGKRAATIGFLGIVMVAVLLVLPIEPQWVRIVLLLLAVILLGMGLALAAAPRGSETPGWLPSRDRRPTDKDD